MSTIRSCLPGSDIPKIVFPEGLNTRILKAASIIKSEGLVEPILLGSKKKIHTKISKLGITNLGDATIVNPEEMPYYEDFAKDFFSKRQRKGASFSLSRDLMKRGTYFSSMMVKNEL